MIVGGLVSYSPLLGLAVALVVWTSYEVLRRPILGVWLLVALTPVSSGLRRGLIVSGLRPSEALIAWLAPLVIIGARRPVPRWGTVEWVGLLYAVANLVLGALDLRARGGQFTQANLGQLLGPFEYLALFRAVRIGVATHRDRDLTAAILLLASAPLCLLALLQGFGAHWAHHLQVSLTGLNLGHPERATALFTNWQVLAGYLLSVGLLAAAVFAYRARNILPSRVALLLLLLDGAALARTLTIGALVGWVVGCVILMAMAGRVQLTRRQLALLASLGLALITAVFVARFHQQYGSTGASKGIVPKTISDRVTIWTKQYIPALSGRWVTGYGPGIPIDVGWKYTESVYVTMVLRGGLLLLGIYLALMGTFIDRARRLRGTSSEQQALAAGLLVLVVLLFPLQTIATYFTTSGLPEVLWITAALVVSREALVGSRNRPQPPPARGKVIRPVGVSSESGHSLDVVSPGES